MKYRIYLFQNINFFFFWNLFSGVLGYLNHNDLIQLLKQLKLTLKKTGILVIKDNCVGNGCDPEFDPDDQYYVRTGEQFYDAAHRSGFIIVKDQRSKLKQIVRELLPIRIFVLALKWNSLLIILFWFHFD